MIGSTRHARQLRELITRALGISSAALLVAAGCGGKAVVDGDPAATGGTGAGGAGGSGTTTGQTTVAVGVAASTGSGFTCNPPLQPGDELIYACLSAVPEDACPAASSPYVLQDLEAQLGYNDPNCNQEFCTCTHYVSSVPCGPDPGANGCCYFAIRSYSEICEGRPFTVDGEARTAPLAHGPGWCAELSPALEGLDATARRALADAWAKDGLFEHASIASFARFALELMAVGAPADLVEGAQRAMADEIEHARLCFGLASAYAGAQIGPGPLAIGDALLSSDLARLAAATVVEGCVNETLAALGAMAARDAATDPAVRAALDRIAADESAHAALAFRFVAWAWANGGEPVRRAVDEAFAAARPAAGPVAPEAEVLRAHGRLGKAELEAVVRNGMDEVVLPAWKALTQGATHASQVATA